MGLPAVNAVGGRISQATIDAVRERADLVELVEARTGPGRPSRGQMMLRCPFHDERTPSFHVHPGDKLYKCFGCGEQGGAVRFRPQDREPRLPRGRRVAGRPVRRRGRARGPVAAATATGSIAPSAPTVCSTTSPRFYERYLERAGGGAGGARLPGRARRLGRVDRPLPARLRAVRLGPRGPLARSREGYPTGAAVEAGVSLAGPARADRPLPRAGITFPLCDARGRVRGFGARVMPGGEGPKYLNSPESEIFKKSRILYGLHLARAADREEATARSWSRATPT